MDHVHVISVDGACQVVAFARAARQDPDDIIGYGVVTTAGTVLGHALTAEEARVLLQRRIAEQIFDRHVPGSDSAASVAPVAMARARRVRR